MRCGRIAFAERPTPAGPRSDRGDGDSIPRSAGRNEEAQARELIGVPPEIEEKLRAFGAKCPGDGPRLLLVVEFRARVLAEFDRQLRAL